MLYLFYCCYYICYNKFNELADKIIFARPNKDLEYKAIDFRYEFLKDFRHCGYSVRPSERKKDMQLKC